MENPLWEIRIWEAVRRNKEGKRILCIARCVRRHQTASVGVRTLEHTSPRTMVIVDRIATENVEGIWKTKVTLQQTIWLNLAPTTPFCHLANCENCKNCRNYRKWLFFRRWNEENCIENPTEHRQQGDISNWERMLWKSEIECQQEKVQDTDYAENRPQNWQKDTIQRKSPDLLQDANATRLKNYDNSL